MDLQQFDWSEAFAPHFTPYAAQGYQVGRIVAQYRDRHTLWTAQGEFTAELSGKFRHQATDSLDFPTIGDWAVVTLRENEQTATIHHLLPRKSLFSRQAAGSETGAQAIAANIDTVFLVSGLDHDFNLRRIERYLTLTWESGATPVILLNKADQCDRPEEREAEVMAIAPGVPLLTLSAALNQGLDALTPYLQPGKTIALIGSSGVGKSTLTNQLMGTAVQATQAVRADDSRGRHTTSHRQLFVLPSGSLLLDTPGLREIQLWGTEARLQETFGDIEQWAEACRFRDCHHEQEPGCAVQAAIAAGQLDPDRLRSYQKLQKELAHLAERQEGRSQINTKKRWKAISQEIRRQNQHKRR